MAEPWQLKTRVAFRNRAAAGISKKQHHQSLRLGGVIRYADIFD